MARMEEEEKKNLRSNEMAASALRGESDSLLGPLGSSHRVGGIGGWFGRVETSETKRWELRGSQAQQMR